MLRPHSRGPADWARAELRGQWGSSLGLCGMCPLLWACDKTFQPESGSSQVLLKLLATAHLDNSYLCWAVTMCAVWKVPESITRVSTGSINLAESHVTWSP